MAKATGATRDVRKSVIRWFDDIRLADVAAVGGKTASLGELRALLGAQIPDGFALTAAAYRGALAVGGAAGELRRLLDDLDHHNVAQLAERAAAARRIVYEASGDAELHRQIVAAYRTLEERCGVGVAVAVRSSATAEDLPTASFAGQHDSFLHVRGSADVVEACRRCFASIFTDRAIVYRIDNGFDHFKVALSVGVMKMVRSDLAASGVIFTLDTESGFRDVVFVTGSWGLGENIVQGNVDPDEFYVHKPTFREGYRAVLSRSLGGKEARLVYGRGRGAASTRNLKTRKSERERFCLADAEVLKLADCAIRIEDHYSGLAGHPTPMDIEWAKDGGDGGLYIVQARPETATACWPGSCSVSAVISRCARPCGSASPRERRRFLGPVPSAAGATMSSASIGVLAAAPYPHGSCRSGHCRSRPYGFLRKPLARCAAILRRRLGLTEHAAISASWDRRALPAISVSRRCVGYVCHHRFPLVRPRKGVRRPGIIIGSGGRGVASAQFIPPPRSGASS